MPVWILRHLSCLNPFRKILSRGILSLGHPDPCKSLFYCLVCRLDFPSGRLMTTYFIKYSDQNLLVFLEKSESHIIFSVVIRGRILNMFYLQQSMELYRTSVIFVALLGIFISMQNVLYLCSHSRKCCVQDAPSEYCYALLIDTKTTHIFVHIFPWYTHFHPDVCLYLCSFPQCSHFHM